VPEKFIMIQSLYSLVLPVSNGEDTKKVSSEVESAAGVGVLPPKP
jgi:hypothetical protein